MSIGGLTDADYDKVLAIMADFKKQGFEITIEIAIKHINNPNAIFQDLVHEKPVLDNSAEILSEKRLKEAEKLVIDLSVIGHTITLEQSMLFCQFHFGNSEKIFNEFCEENGVSLKVHDITNNNKCVSGGGSSSKKWECEICTFNENAEPNDICVCCGDNRKLNSNVPVRGPFRDANNGYKNSNGPTRSSNNNDCPGYRNSSNNSSSNIDASKGSSVENSTGWTCKTCTFLNDDNLASNCKVCMVYK
jgi:hypothetical protein